MAAPWDEVFECVKRRLQPPAQAQAEPPRAMEGAWGEVAARLRERYEAEEEFRLLAPVVKDLWSARAKEEDRLLYRWSEEDRAHVLVRSRPAPEAEPTRRYGALEPSMVECQQALAALVKAELDSTEPAAVPAA